MKEKDAPEGFYEVQYMAKEQLIMAVVVWGITIFSWAVFAVQIVLGIPVGNIPAPDYMVWLIMLSFGIIFPLVMFSLRLQTRVADKELQYRYYPFHIRWRTIGFDDINNVKFAEYSGLKEFGGWGIRRNRRGKAYTVAGKYGVWITLKDKSEILIGSKRAGELEKVLSGNSSG